MTWGDAYYEHMTRHFGPPVTREVYSASDEQPSIQVLGFDGVLANCRTFVSLGLSHYIVEVGRVGELVVPVSAGWGSVGRVLANTLFYVVAEEMRLGWGMSIGGVQTVCKSFAEEFGKAALYVTEPYDFPGVERVSWGNAEGRLFLGVFITAQEHEFFKERGAEELESLLEKKNVDPYELNRASCI